MSNEDPYVFKISEVQDLAASIGTKIDDITQQQILKNLNYASAQLNYYAHRMHYALTEKDVSTLIYIRKNIITIKTILYTNLDELMPKQRQKYSRIIRQTLTKFNSINSKGKDDTYIPNALYLKIVNAISNLAERTVIGTYGVTPTPFTIDSEIYMDYNAGEILFNITKAPNTTKKIEDILLIIDETLNLIGCNLTTFFPNHKYKTIRLKSSRNADDVPTNIFLILLSNIYQKYFNNGKRPVVYYSDYTNTICNDWTHFAFFCLNCMGISSISQDAIAYRWIKLKKFTCIQYLESLIERKFISVCKNKTDEIHKIYIGPYIWDSIDSNSIPLHDTLIDLF